MKLTADLREYAESLGVSVNRDFSNGIELAVLHFLDGNISLLRQIEELHSIKKEEIVSYSSPHERCASFPHDYGERKGEGKKKAAVNICPEFCRRRG